MPSIRVRRRAYTTIDGSPNLSSSPRPLATIFARPASASDLPDAQPENNTPILTGNSGNTGHVSRRERSYSRVHHYCTQKQQSMRMTPTLPLANAQSRTTQTHSQRSTSSVAYHAENGMVTMEGQQTDYQMASNGEPGLIGSALSLSHSNIALSQNSGIGGRGPPSDISEDGHHHDDIVEHLDVIDPQVGTVSNLTNACNAILIPPLSFYSRKPIVILSSPPSLNDDEEQADHTQEFSDSLDRHVDDVLKRPSKFRRTMKGVWSFLKTPLGVVAGIYGFLVVFWGAAIVIFLLKIINFHNANTQGFWVEVSSQVTNGLFTVTGIGLIPSRVLDTYRVYKIWLYKRRTRKLRAKAGLPQLFDVDDLPDPAYDPNYVHVLTDKEQKDLHRQQVKFQHHQTWYRPHGTETHRAFPINTALLICLFNDGNSIFQIMLCCTMWSLNRFQRPAWSTGCLIPFSFLCGILSAVFIWKGGQKTKRTAVVAAKLRAALAMEHPYDYDVAAALDVVPPMPKINSLTGERLRDGFGDEEEEEERRTTTSMDHLTEKPGIEDSIAVDERMTVPSSDKTETS